MKTTARIVSLIASATEIVHALGLSAFQVGRSHECDYPDSIRALPVCTASKFDASGDSRQIDRLVKETLRDATSVYAVFDDILDELKPTHVLTQSQCRVCAVSIDYVQRALASRVAGNPIVVALEPNSLDDVWQDIHRVAKALGCEPQRKALGDKLQSRMQDIAERASASTRPTVACIEWIEPLMAAGNWVPELVEMAGGVNLFGQAGAHSPWMTWQDLIDREPDVIVAMPCGFDLDRTRREMYWLEQRPEWPTLKAVRRGRIYITDGNQFFNRPGPRLVESLEILAQVTHPESFGPTFEGIGWARWVPA